MWGLVRSAGGADTFCRSSEGEPRSLIVSLMRPRFGKRGPQGKNKNGVWRIHSAFDLPQERFGHFELTDQKEGERLDRIAPIGEIRLLMACCSRSAWHA